MAADFTIPNVLIQDPDGQPYAVLVRPGHAVHTNPAEPAKGLATLRHWAERWPDPFAPAADAYAAAITGAAHALSLVERVNTAGLARVAEYKAARHG